LHWRCLKSRRARVARISGENLALLCVKTRGHDVRLGTERCQSLLGGLFIVEIQSRRAVVADDLCFRNVSNSYATKDAQAISKATQQVSMMIQICLRWIEAF
jgi:hypothetical protein